ANRSALVLGLAASALSAGTYRLEGEYGDPTLAALGFRLGAYGFDRYAKAKERPTLELPKAADAAEIETLVTSAFIARDLVNTPANDLGPDALEAWIVAFAETHGVETNVVRGDDLLAQNFPMIHAVGRASDQAPRLVDFSWGDAAHPRLTLVGKGVTFDTGGLNIKPGNSMALMKKDMGGAAAVLGLAHMIMATGMEVQLRVLIPAVENSVSGNAFRPGDILTSRKGLTVEINNTDAEGRLVLADALALADEDKPDQIISMATLTGAARVAVGPDLAPYYSDDAAFVSALESAAAGSADPVWRMPFHDAYEALIEPGIADLDNAPKGGFAGSITAALFLRRFVTENKYAHFDIYGWQPADAPARPKGGTGQGTRAIYAALPALLKP
ncbi:MAG TPA: leucyl aminopeptidase, partial [Sulfitobacter sp.]|nr:leucyl aminopeptidase [Sulfitobacter sp.]